VRNEDGFPCLGVIHRLEPDGRIYCTRCGGNARGAIYVKRGGWRVVSQVDSGGSLVRRSRPGSKSEHVPEEDPEWNVPGQC
jgi:hypothetical protein